MADLFREIEEDLRRERAERLWKKYGGYVIGAALGIVLTTSGYVGFKEYTSRQRLADGERYAAALVELRPGAEASAAEALAMVAREVGSGYAMLARLREAALRAEAGERGGAIAIYDAIAADDGVEPLFRDPALLLSVMHQMDAAGPDALIERLAPLTADDNPWRHSALEASGVLAFRSGAHGRAREIFTRLADDATTPRALRARAAEMLAILGE
ncbi:MAG: tetratricopeptide repeat protein [Kiloniellales bacterium]